MTIILFCCSLSCEMNVPALSKEGMAQDSFPGSQSSPFCCSCVMFKMWKLGLGSTLLCHFHLGFVFPVSLRGLSCLVFSSPLQFPCVWGLLREGSLAWSGAFSGASCCSHSKGYCGPLSATRKSPPTFRCCSLFICLLSSRLGFSCSQASRCLPLLSPIQRLY